MTKLYFVLSVRDIKALLTAAKANQKRYRRRNDLSKDNHTIVLHLETAPGWTAYGEEQISTASLLRAITDL